MWKDLSMGERAALIKIAVDSGIHSIDDIVNTYNSYAEGGELKDITPIRATPTLKKKSWETDEEYKERISSYNKVDTAAIIAENQRIIEENKRNRQQYPKIDRILDTLGILQNTGDFVKFGYNTLTNNKYKDGGYKPSSSIRKRISNWEGSSMKTNRSFEAEARDFNASLPKGATSRLSQTQLDGLYSYSYNVGAGNFRKRVNPVLTRYLAGQATIQDVQRSMWASKDNKLRGLAKRRNAERAMLGNYTPMDFGPMSNTTTMMINHYLPETEPIEIPQLQFNDIINIPKPIELEPSTPYSSSDIDFSDPGSSLANALDIIQMIRRPRKINIYT